MAKTLTPYYDLGKWDDGDNPGAPDLNANWTMIDLLLFAVDAMRETYDYDVQVDLNAIQQEWKFRTLAQKTADYTIPAGESQYIYSNKDASGQVIYRLPPGTAPFGKSVTCIVMSANNVRITGDGADQIRVAASISTATTGHIDNATIGGAITLVNVQSNVWLAISQEGVWTVT